MQQNEFVKGASFKITREQIEKVRPYLPNVEKLMSKISDFQNYLDDAILNNLYTADGLEYEDTEISSMLQQVYDEVYEQNIKSGKESRIERRFTGE